MDNTEKLRAAEEKVNRLAEAQRLSERLENYRARTEEAEKQVKALLKDRGRFSELIGDLKQSVVAVEPYPHVKYKQIEPSSSPISPVMMLSDIHTGERTDPREIEGFGEYNWDLEQKFAFQYVDKFLDWSAMHRRAGFPMHDAHIFSIGDLVSGNVHYELEVTNEFPVTVATANAGYLVAEMVSRIAPHFESVHLWEESGDNHGRLTRKNQFKQGARNNFSYLAHVIANQALEKHKNIWIHEGEGLTLMAEVQGKKFLLKHGHTIKGWAGLPFYGFERDSGREARTRMGSGAEFDYIAVGHFHVPGWPYPWLLMNGSMSGTSELDHALGRHAPSSQVSFMVHPKHGVFDFTAWRFHV